MATKNSVDFSPSDVATLDKVWASFTPQYLQGYRDGYAGKKPTSSGDQYQKGYIQGRANR